MEDILNVKAESRNQVGKIGARRLRNRGYIPAIIYGGGKDTIPISIPEAEIQTILKSEKGENTILSIHRDDLKVHAMVKELQYDHLSTTIIHADLIRIDLDKPIEVYIPIRLTGEAVGVKLEEGVFDFVTREVGIRCLPARIPKEFVVDVTDLHIGSSIKLEDLDVEQDVEWISDPNTTICSVVTRKAIEEEEVVEEELEEGEEAAVEGEGEAAEGEEAEEKKTGEEQSSEEDTK